MAELSLASPTRVIAPLRLWPKDATAATRAGLLALVGVAALVVAADLAFRAFLPGWYLATFTAPLWPRMGVFMARAFWEEAQFRLLMVTGLWLLVRAVLRGREPTWAVPVILVLAQLANIAPHLPAPESIALSAWYALRYLAPGVVWGWLYWRHGFLTAAAAHPLCHLVLDPALLATL